MTRNIPVIVLVIMIIVLASYIYRCYHENIFSNFPLGRDGFPRTESKAIFLFFYFHSHDCPECLEVIQMLNNLPRHFCVKGIVPKNELKDEDGIRRMTGAIFPFESIEKYNKFIPPISPALIGVSEEKTVLFILPAVPGQKDYILDFLQSFYYSRIS